MGWIVVAIMLLLLGGFGTGYGLGATDDNPHCAGVSALVVAVAGLAIAVIGSALWPSTPAELGGLDNTAVALQLTCLVLGGIAGWVTTD